MVRRRKVLLAVLPGIVWALATGCGPSREQLSMDKAMSARVDLYPSYQESARFLQKYLAKRDKDYVMWSMDYVSLCLMSGNYDQARGELHRCYEDITTRQDTDKEKAAALSNESMKIFKGEPFERAMVCTYLGLMHYLSGDYNNARIFFARANLEDATTADNMKNFRDDFPLAHYWLGRAFMRLGQNDNARIAYKKAGQRIPRKGQDKETRAIEKRQNKLRKKRMGLEQKCYKQAISDKESAEGVVDISASPAIDQMPSLLPPAKQLIDRDNLPLPPASSLAEFLAPDYQQQVNLILMIEIGSAPIKLLVGESGERDKIVRSAYEERRILVYLDGQQVGRAFAMLDMFHQADTRGSGEKDRAQVGKGVAKAVLKRLPYVGYVAAYWDVRADHRYWHLLPGEIHVFAAKVKPGLYTVDLRCFDSNGYLLPRYNLTKHHMPVREDQDNIFLLHTKYDADNTFVGEIR